MRLHVTSVPLLLVGLGCTPVTVDLTEKRCPCATGWICDEERGICLEGFVPRDAGPAERDAAPTDAGPMDAGDASEPRDGGTDGGPDGGTPCTEVLADVIFCDGLDDPMLSAWPFRFGDDPVGRITDRVYRGAGAIHAMAPPGEILGLEVRGLPDPGDNLYLRAYVYVPSSIESTNFQFLFIGEAGGDSNGIGMGIRMGGIPYLYSNTAGMGAGPNTQEVPLDTWTCLQGYVGISDTDGVLEMSVNGRSLQRLEGIDTRAEGPYTELATGITWSYWETGPTSVWIDEVAVGRSPLPCD